MFDPNQLLLESLEERQMLSTVQIMAAGSEGVETFDLLVDQTIVASFQVSGFQPEVFEFESNATVTADQVRIQFTNDLYDPENGVDRNLIVDHISIDGVIFETESPTTFSTGTYTSETGIVPGNFESEVLHSDGFFQYSQASVIEIIAAGSTGDEEFLIEVNGEVLDTLSVSQDFDRYVVTTELPVDPKLDIVRVEFTNDLFVAGSVDRDLFVDKIIVDGIAYESEADSTYSTGTWVDFGVPHEGFLNSETLHVTGYFEYLAATDVVIDAFGDEGTEQIRLLLDGEAVETFDLSTTNEPLVYRHNTKLQPWQVSVEFFDDLYDPENGIDKNVTVTQIQIGDEVIDPRSNNVYSNATFSIDGLVPGFGRGQTLHVDGIFQFGFQPVSDIFSIAEDSKNVPLAILANDFLIGNPGFELVGLPSQGSAKIVDGELRYTPDENFVGTDRLSYRLLGGSEATVEVVIEVNESFQQPQSLIDPRIPDEISPSGKTLQVSKLVQLPFDDNGRPPRVNMMTTLGQRTFVVTDGAFGGNARIFELVSDSVGSVQAILFFDVGQAIATYGNGTSIDGGSPLNGLRSAAFHPNFGINGKFYVTFVGTRPEQDNGTIYLSNPENPVAVESVLAEFTFDFESNSVDPESYREVFRVGMPVNDHPIRQAVFNPYAVEGDRDFGLLYIGHGDGSEQSAVAGDGQNQDALGKIIRIDPLATETASFTIPEFNPFSESGDYPTYVYAVGFRNPHNLSFAIGENDETQLIVTDIGRDNIEEINIVIAGGNYGWADREGTFVHLNGPGQTNGVNSNIAALPENDAENDFIYPVSQLGHDGEIGDPFVGQAIAGGHVIQNGSSELADQFIFLEFATDGRAFHFDFTDAQNQTTSLDIADVDRDSPDELTWLTPSELTILFDHDDDPLTTPLVRNSLKDVLDDEPDFQTVLTSGKVRADLRLGRGPDGELYVLNKRNGWIYLATNTVAPTPDESA